MLFHCFLKHCVFCSLLFSGYVIVRTVGWKAARGGGGKGEESFKQIKLLATQEYCLVQQYYLRPHTLLLGELNSSQEFRNRPILVPLITLARSPTKPILLRFPKVNQEFFFLSFTVTVLDSFSVFLEATFSSLTSRPREEGRFSNGLWYDGLQVVTVARPVGKGGKWPAFPHPYDPASVSSPFLTCQRCICDMNSKATLAQLA